MGIGRAIKSSLVKDLFILLESYLKIMKRPILYIVGILYLALIGCFKNPAALDTVAFKWEFTSPEQQGMMTHKLDSAFIQAKQLGFVDGLLIIRNGFVVGEHYYNGYDESTPHHVMSVSKSFLSAMMGIALEKGFIISLDDKVMNYFPEYVYAGMDERKKDITIRHLMTIANGNR